MVQHAYYFPTTRKVEAGGTQLWDQPMLSETRPQNKDNWQYRPVVEGLHSMHEVVSSIPNPRGRGDMEYLLSTKVVKYLKPTGKGTLLKLKKVKVL